MQQTNRAETKTPTKWAVNCTLRRSGETFWEPLRSTSSCAPASTIPVGVAPLALWWAGS